VSPWLELEDVLESIEIFGVNGYARRKFEQYVDLGTRINGIKTFKVGVGYGVNRKGLSLNVDMISQYTPPRNS